MRSQPENGPRPCSPTKKQSTISAPKYSITKQASDAAFQAAKDKFGERGVVDMLGVMGYYQFVSMMLNVDHYPLPDGAQPELKPLR